jgi:integrase
MLTKSQLDRAQPKAARYVLWDHKLPGFGVRVTPAGKKSFILTYRLRGTRRAITATIGSYGKITLDQAREKARKIAATVELDGDPVATRKERTKAEGEDVLTVDGLVARYLEAFDSGRVASKRLRGRAASGSYLRDTRHYLERFTAAYGQQAAVSVTQDRIERLLHGCDRQTATQWHLHGTIDRLYRWARRQGLATVNPAAEIETAKPAARERSLTLAELSALWHAAEGLSQPYGDLVHLLIATGQRLNEVAGMTWGEIDLVAGLWTLPGGRTKARRQHIIPLPKLAVALLKARQKARESRAAGSNLVLPTLAMDRTTLVKVNGWSWLKQTLTCESGVTEWRFHDFRRSLVTILAESGVNIAVLDSMLNHAASATRGGVIGVYQKATLLEPMRDAMRIWNRLLENAIAPAEEKVVGLRG